MKSNSHRTQLKQFRNIITDEINFQKVMNHIYNKEVKENLNEIQFYTNH